MQIINRAHIFIPKFELLRNEATIIFKITFILTDPITFSIIFNNYSIFCSGMQVNYNLASQSKTNNVHCYFFCFFVLITHSLEFIHELK